MTFRVDGVSASYPQRQRNYYCDHRMKKITVAVSVLCVCHHSCVCVRFMCVNPNVRVSCVISLLETQPIGPSYIRA